MTARSYEALGAVLGASDAAGDDPVDDAGVEASTDGGAATLGFVVEAGVLHATTAPPSEAARPRASRIRLIMTGGSSVAKGAGGSGASVAWGATTTTHDRQRGRTTARFPRPEPLQRPVIARAPRARESLEPAGDDPPDNSRR